MEKIKIMIVEDQLIFRKGLKLILSEMEQVQLMVDAGDGKEFLEIIKKDMPDIVLMDIQMPGMDGIEATKAAVALYPDLKILVVSLHGEEECLLSMLEAGARGFLLKNTDDDELKKAILTVYAGKNYFSNDLLPALTSAYMKKKTYTHDKNDIIEKLSPREIEVLRYICKGYTNKEIAEACFISDRTAGGHRGNLLAKTGCRNTAQLVAFGIKYNLINTDDGSQK
jgi:DNA-binding NarL/FixJ family response regulator